MMSWNFDQRSKGHMSTDRLKISHANHRDSTITKESIFFVSKPRNQDIHSSILELI